MLYILCGIPFAGKSTLAQELVHKLHMTRIDLDEIKFALYGQGVFDHDLKQKDWDAIYQTMYAQIKDALQKGETVVHDTGNFTRYERSLVSTIARDLDIPFRTIFVNTPVDVAKQRLIDNRVKNQRFDVTDRDFLSAVREMEVPLETECPLTLNYGEDVAVWIRNTIA